MRSSTEAALGGGGVKQASRQGGPLSPSLQV